VSSRRAAALEIGLALGALNLGWLALFRRYPWPLGGWDEPLPAGVLALAALLVARTLAGSGHRLGTLDKPGLTLALGTLLVFYLLQAHGGRVGNDGAMLFAYTRSLVIDRDLDLANEFQDYVPDKFFLTRPRERQWPKQEIGTALLWTPFYAAAHLGVLAGAAGPHVPPDGYGAPYRDAVALAGFAWGAVGVWVSYRLARRFFGAAVAGAAALVLWASAPLLWYTVFEPSMTHAVSTAAVAVFLSLWLRARAAPTLAAWSLLAFAAGALVAIQRYDAYLLALPALTLAGRLPRFVTARRRDKWPRAATAALLMSACFFAGTLPLWLKNLATTDAWLIPIDVPSHALRGWREPLVVELLFSSKHGLLSWTPAVTVALVGLVLLTRREPALALSLLATLALGVCLLASTWDWHAGAAFGSRRFTEAFPLFLLGLCRALEGAWRVSRASAVGLCALLVGWNTALVHEVRESRIPAVGTFAFSEVAARAVGRVYRAVGHPFAIPANWAFAWRYGVTPDRFDHVVGHGNYRRIEVAVGTADDTPFLGRGWSGVEGEPGATYRWSVGASSSWLLPLEEPRPYRLTLVGQAIRPPPGSGPQQVGVVVNGRAAGTLEVPAQRATVELVVPGMSWRRGLNEVVFEYAYTARARDLYGGGDGRPLALRLHALALQPAGPAAER
jgi:hypothetical protein